MIPLAANYIPANACIFVSPVTLAVYSASCSMLLLCFFVRVLVKLILYFFSVLSLVNCRGPKLLIKALMSKLSLVLLRFTTI